MTTTYYEKLVTRFATRMVILFSFVMLPVEVISANVQPTVEVVVTFADGSETTMSPQDIAFAKLPDGKELAFLTEWDDNNNEDKHAAELLNKYGYKGTFCLPGSGGPMMRPENMKFLVDRGMEIAAHSQTHPVMGRLSYRQCLAEAVLPRLRLMELSGQPVRTFAYPYCHGWAAQRNSTENYVLEAVLAAGYLCDLRVAETNGLIRYIEKGTFGSETPFFNTKVHWLFSHSDADFQAVDKAFNNAMKEPTPILSLATHSWEFTNEERWQRLERILAAYAHRPSIWYTTHGELASYLYGLKLIQIGKIESNGKQASIAFTIDDPVPIFFTEPITVLLNKRLAVASVHVNGQNREYKTQERGPYFNLLPEDFLDRNLNVRVEAQDKEIFAPAHVSITVEITGANPNDIKVLVPDGWRITDENVLKNAITAGTSRFDLTLAVSPNAQLGVKPIIVRAIATTDHQRTTNYGMCYVNVLPRVVAEISPLYMEYDARSRRELPFFLSLENESPEPTDGFFRFTCPDGWRVRPAQVDFRLLAGDNQSQLCWLENILGKEPVRSFILNGELYLGQESALTRAACRGAKVRRFLSTPTWLLCGPMPQQVDINLAHRGAKLSKYKDKMGHPARWQRLGANYQAGSHIDFEALWPGNDQAAAYALTFWYAREAKDCFLHVRSDGAVKTWINDHLIFSLNSRHNNDVVPIHLKKGLNKILLRVEKISGAWGLSCRLSEESERPPDSSQEAVDVFYPPLCSADLLIDTGESDSSYRVLNTKEDLNQPQGTLSMWVRTPGWEKEHYSCALANTTGSIARYLNLMHLRIDKSSDVSLGLMTLDADPYEGPNHELTALKAWPNNERWHHLIAVWDSQRGLMRLFLDGKQIASSIDRDGDEASQWYSQPVSCRQISIGSENQQAQVKNFKMFRQALDDFQIAMLYAMELMLLDSSGRGGDSP